MEQKIYILISNKNNTEKNLWEVISEDNTKGIYIIKSRETKAYVKKDSIILIKGYNNIYEIDNINLRIFKSKINLNETDDYINSMCFNCDNRCGDTCKIKNISVYEVDYDDCWFNSNGNEAVDMGYLEDIKERI